MNPAWVNMVQRTQTAHLPDPYDPTPVEQGITVYYTDINYGRISFAVIEDRKWKSGPKGLCPPTGGRPDHVTDSQVRSPHGRRARGRALGQPTIGFPGRLGSRLAGHRLQSGPLADHLLRIVQPPRGNLMRLVVDYDCNGWPQSGRNRALYELRARFRLAHRRRSTPGLDHPAGIDQFNDAAWSLCVPSIAAGYPRVWQPLEPGQEPAAGGLRLHRRIPRRTGKPHHRLGGRQSREGVSQRRCRACPRQGLGIRHRPAQ